MHTPDVHGLAAPKRLWQWLPFLPLAVVMLTLTVAAAMRADIGALFDEGSITTHASACILMGCALAALLGWRTSCDAESDRSRIGAALPWLLLALGFLYLVIDEELQLHEHADEALHIFLAIRPTAWSDRIDDLIVLGYGMFGLGFITLFRHRFAALFRQRRLLRLTAAWFAAMVLLDLASNAYPGSVARHFTGPEIHLLKTGSAVLEETCKLMAEWSLLLVLLSASPARGFIGALPPADRVVNSAQAR